MKPLSLLLILLTSCSEFTDGLADKDHTHDYAAKNHSHPELEERIKSLEAGPQINYQGQEAEAIKELLKQSPFIKVK